MICLLFCISLTWNGKINYLEYKYFRKSLFFFGLFSIKGEVVVVRGGEEEREVVEREDVGEREREEEEEEEEEEERETDLGTKLN